VPLFGRRKGPEKFGRDVFEGLRQQILHLDPASVGMARESESSPVWGGMLEMGYPNATVSFVCLRDGTTSMYTSSGGGIIGAGEHAAVVSANTAFLAVLVDHLAVLRPDSSESVPAKGCVVLRALTYDGQRIFEADKDDVFRSGGVLAPVFAAANEVITQLRLLDENHAAGRQPG
jgi:hypothetical protein